jgi:uncharacterized repeat protein (TIGR03806 family)
MRSLAAIVSLLLLGSCDSPAAAPGPLTLSEWHLFTDMAHQVPAADLIPYDVIAPLFSDYATKHRFIRLPAGAQITIDANGELVFPEESVIVKTFGFLADLRDPTSLETLVETRLLWRHGGRWVPLIYVYDADMQEARLWQYGRHVQSTWLDASGTRVSIPYHVPDAIQCANCHGGADPVHLLGVRVRQLDRTHDYGGSVGVVNQLDHLVAIGALASVPAPADRHPLTNPFDTTQPLEARARSYLEANCANCHRVNGGSDQSGLLLGVDITDPIHLGICKDPAAPGMAANFLRVDIMPGHADQSVLIYRVESEVPGVKMPELPTVLHHAEGAQLLTDWVNAMAPNDCTGMPPADAGLLDASVDARAPSDATLADH